MRGVGRQEEMRQYSKAKKWTCSSMISFTFSPLDGRSLESFKMQRLKNNGSVFCELIDDILGYNEEGPLGILFLLSLADTGGGGVSVPLAEQWSVT